MILISVLTSLLVSAGACAVLSWATIFRVRLIERELADFQADLLSEKRKRAGIASGGARAAKVNADDARVVKEHTGVDLVAAQDAAEQPWWSDLVGKRQ